MSNEASTPASARLTVRSLAAEAKRPVAEVVARLAAAGHAIRHGNQSLEGRALREARRTLGLTAYRGQTPPPPPARRLSRDELTVQLLGPLLAKGKLGRNHTTDITNVCGTGVPAHQKAEAKALAEEFLANVALADKVSQGRQHVWLTNRGRAVLEAARRALGLPVVER